MRGIRDALVEPYPQLIAGTPTGWRYGRSTRVLEVSYSTVRADGRGAFATSTVSMIDTPPLIYRGRNGAPMSGGSAARRAAHVAVRGCRRIGVRRTL
ncbi:MAG: hypothetical protein ACYC91_11310 [Solirubrobacteraceae bacterium]